MMDYTLRKIYPWSACKVGFLLGAALGLLPGLILGVASGGLGMAIGGMSDSSGFNGVLGGGSGILGFLVTFIFVVLSMAITYAISLTIASVLYNIVAAIGGGLKVKAESLGGFPVMQQFYPAQKPAPVLPGPAQVPPAALPAAVVAANAAWGGQPAPVQPAPVPQPAPAVYQQQAPAPVAPQPAPAVQAPARPRLVSTLHPDVELPLEPTITRLGSASENDIVLPGAAPKHAEIRFEDGRAVLYDFSGGQTWVQGRPVRDANMLKDGFKVQFGPQEMVYRSL